MNSSAPPLATVLIPAFNEGESLAMHLRTIMQTLATSEGTYAYEVLVVDDGSTDDTYAVARAHRMIYPNLRVVRHRVNRGLGAALRTGAAAARGCAIVVFDSDLSYRPEIIGQLLAQLDRDGADIVLASPYMRGGHVRNVPWMRRVLSREANRFLSFATNGRYATATCMVRAYRSSVLRQLPSTENRMEINVELLFNALRAGAKVVEIPATLEWSAQRARARARVSIRRTLKQIGRTLRYGVAYRPAVLLSLPGILPGVLPLIVGSMVLAHATLKTIAIVTIITMVIQNASLVLFAGQLTAFFRNVFRRRAAL